MIPRFHSLDARHLQPHVLAGNNPKLQRACQIPNLPGRVLLSIVFPSDRCWHPINANVRPMKLILISPYESESN